MEDVYAFMDKYIQEEFDEEKVLKSSPRGTVVRIRHRQSHRRYICRRYREAVQIYFDLQGKECPYLPNIFEAAQKKRAAFQGNWEDTEKTEPSFHGEREETQKAELSFHGEREEAQETQSLSQGIREEAQKTRHPFQGKEESEPLQERMIVLEEFVPGDTLAMLLQSGPLSSALTRRTSIQLCRALYVLHSLGWVHRDIKPDNVIIHGDRAVLIDWDAARSYSTEKARDTRILGTVGYAPPEQYGISETDYRADIYAMGVLMNEMLTGEHPSQTLAKGRWGRIISRCTMIQPDKRYHSVKELMEAL